MRSHRGGAKPADFLRLYLESEYAGDKHRARREALLTAYELRALVVILDGVDEASGLKPQVEEFVLKSLAQDRIGLVVTARPEVSDRR